MDLGKIIKAGREKNGFTQADLGKLMGVQPSSVSCWETNQRVPPGDVFFKLVAVLDIVPELFPGYVRLGDNNLGGSSIIQIKMISLAFAYRGGVPHNVTDREIFDIHGILSKVPVPKPGSMVMLELFSATPIISGALSATPTINGVKTPTDLSTTISTGFVHAVAEIVPDKPGFVFTSSQLLGLVITTSPDWKNDNGDIVASLYVQM